MDFVYNDGGRAAAGYRGRAGDCVVRAIAIAAQKPYQDVYDAINAVVRQNRISSSCKNIVRRPSGPFRLRMKTCLGNRLAEGLRGRRGSISYRTETFPDEASRWSAAEGSLNRLDCLRLLAARSDDADLPPEGFQQYLPTRAAARPLALEYLWPVLNESGCGDNTQDSFSRSFADALLRTRSRDP